MFFSFLKNKYNYSAIQTVNVVGGELEFNNLKKKTVKAGKALLPVSSSSLQFSFVVRIYFHSVSLM